MKSAYEIVTVGFCPSWDTVCRVEGIDWGQHNVIIERTTRPAGKGLNVSRALAWMGTSSVAAGFWGEEDYRQMLRAAKQLRRHVRLRFTVVDGRTRENITVLDTMRNREMHLRSASELGSRKAFKELRADLRRIVKKNSICVFSGSMPTEEFLSDIISIVKWCQKAGAKVVVDTSGEALKAIVDSGGLWLIKPNIDELRQLLGKEIEDETAELAKAAHKLLDKTEMVLVSRGQKGTLLVGKDDTIECRCLDSEKCIGHEVFSITVGCGDYLLGGFLEGLTAGEDLATALRTAVKVATARAWGWVETQSWSRAKYAIHVS